MKNYAAYLGQPWVYIKNDCIAVVRKVLREQFGVQVPTIDLPTERKTGLVLQAFETERNKPYWIRCDEPKEGRVMLFYDNHDKPIHVGICIDRKHVLHCHGSPKQGGETVIEEIKYLSTLLFKRFEYYEYNASDR